ncbi:hypothetical protein NC651_033796 [Populus alba x Populus x berolinensis]|nr:hypothetical protein NC651_033796 [Populus alba x Populus x berolinensis]
MSVASASSLVLPPLNHPNTINLSTANPIHSFFYLLLPRFLLSPICPLGF